VPGCGGGCCAWPWRGSSCLVAERVVVVVFGRGEGYGRHVRPRRGLLCPAVAEVAVLGRGHYRNPMVCRVSETLGEDQYTLSKMFADGRPRQRLHGKGSDGKQLFAERFFSRTRQRECRVLFSTRQKKSKKVKKKAPASFLALAATTVVPRGDSPAARRRGGGGEAPRVLAVVSTCSRPVQEDSRGPPTRADPARERGGGRGGSGRRCCSPSPPSARRSGRGRPAPHERRGRPVGDGRRCTSSSSSPPPGPPRRAAKSRRPAPALCRPSAPPW